VAFKQTYIQIKTPSSQDFYKKSG